MKKHSNKFLKPWASPKDLVLYLQFLRNRPALLAWHRSLAVFAFVFLVWSIYRLLLLRFPVEVEEGVLKAVVFGGAVFWVALVKDRWRLTDLGLTSTNLFASVYLGLALGILLGFTGQLGNIIRHGGLNLSTFGLNSETLGGFLILSLVTAFWEQLLFSGYLSQRLMKPIGSEWMTALVVGGMYVVLHIPALAVVQQLPVSQIMLASFLLFMLSCGNTILMLRMKNLAAPVLAQAIWGVTVFLFR